MPSSRSNSPESSRRPRSANLRGPSENASPRGSPDAMRKKSAGSPHVSPSAHRPPRPVLQPPQLVPSLEEKIARNPRLQELHNRYLRFCAGIEDGSQDSEQSRLWQQACDTVMSVNVAEMKAIELVGPGDALPETDATLALMGRQPPSVRPSAPVPRAVRRSLPSGDPIHGREELLQAGDVFDAEHRLRTKHAHECLSALVPSRGADLANSASYHRRLEDLKRHRFYLNERVEGPGDNRAETQPLGLALANRR